MNNGSIIETFLTYFGNYITIFFFGIVIILFLLLIDKEYRLFWGTFFACLVLFVYNDLALLVIGTISSDSSAPVYYRFLWMVPWITILGVTIILLIEKGCSIFKNKKERMIPVLAMLLSFGIGIISILTNHSIYNTLSMHPTKNGFYTDAELIEIANIIDADSENHVIKYMAYEEPYKNLQLISEKLEPAFEREYGLWQFLINDNSGSYKALLARLIAFGEIPETESLNSYLEDVELEYIICSNSLQIGNCLTELDFDYFQKTDNYTIYKNSRKTEWIYNDVGQLTSVRYKDPDGNVFLKANEYAGVSYSYNKKGQLTKISYIDQNEKPIAINKGYATKELVYDGHTYSIGEKYYDVNGERCKLPEGYCGYYKNYDNRIWTKSLTYVDESDNPIMTSFGYAKIELEYDDFGNTTCIKYYDENDSLMLFDDDYAIIEMQYDNNNRVIGEKYYDISGNPGREKETYSCKKIEYNDLGKIVSNSFYDDKDELVSCKNGYAIIRYSFLDNKYLERVSTYNTDEVEIGSEERIDYQLLSYLQNAKYDQNTITVISVMDEASAKLNSENRKWLYNSGFEIMSSIGGRQPYLAVIDSGDIIYEDIGEKGSQISYEYQGIKIVSTGYSEDNRSSISYNEEEFSMNYRGFNLVTFDKSKMEVLEINNFDTYECEVMTP